MYSTIWPFHTPDGSICPDLFQLLPRRGTESSQFAAIVEQTVEKDRTEVQAPHALRIQMTIEPTIGAVPLAPYMPAGSVSEISKSVPQFGWGASSGKANLLRAGEPPPPMKAENAYQEAPPAARGSGRRRVPSARSEPTFCLPRETL